MKAVRIVIVDDHAIFRNGLKLMFSKMAAVEVVGEAENGRQFLDLLTETQVDLVFLDIRMPVLDGVESARQAIEKFPDLAIIALTTFRDHDFVNKMLQVGVMGYMLKNSDYEQFEKAVEVVSQGGTYFSDEILADLTRNMTKYQKRIIARQQLPNFTKREQEVLKLICEGLSNQQIANKLCISARTVEKHKKGLMEKTDAENTINLVIYAFKNRLTEVL